MPSHFSVRQLLRSFFRSLFWSLNVLLVLYTLLIYWLLYDLPIQHWSASMFMITLPVAWLFNLIYVVIWLVSNRWRSVLSALTLVAGFWLWPRTVVFNTPQSLPPNQKSVQILSYNVAGFNSEDFYKVPSKPRRSQLLTNWVVQHDAGIKCFQEFYNSQRHPTLNMTKRLRETGYIHEAVLYPNYLQTPDYIVGVAIFSKHPIIDQGREVFGNQGHNGIVWADIAVRSDTIRIINVHLESMGIRVRRVLSQQEMSGVRSETRGILAQLREGFIERGGQIRRVEKYLTSSPYPVIVTGDFNDTPYSVTYGRLRNRLNNAFEDAGQGFGFSLNRAPKLLRIDNQFYNANRLTALQFQTFRDIPYSDHFPILGEFVVMSDQ